MRLRDPGPSATVRARSLRRAMSESERRLWMQLRGSRLGFYFRRQHPLGPYTLDFYCDEARLCVEVDGDLHSETIARDAARDERLRSLGVETVRVSTAELYENPDGVIAAVYNACCKRAKREGICEPHPLPQPPPERARG